MNTPTIYENEFIMNANRAPELNETVPNLFSKKLPNPIYVDMKYAWYDPEFLDTTVTVEFNGTDISTLNWVTYDDATRRLIVVAPTNAEGGLHDVRVIVTDGIPNPGGSQNEI